MEINQTWDVAIPAIPPRSRLYHLEPIGVETPYVECLTSYITRLAEEHCVSVRDLVMREIFPAQGRVLTIAKHYHQLDHLWLEGASSLNGTGPVARQWVETLETLTSCDSLRFLTMLTWSEVIALSRLVRLRKAWCPRCYDEWRQNHGVLYEPLLWTLDGVHICPRHRFELATECPHCQAAQPFLTQSVRLGYCSRCLSRLGSASLFERAESTTLDTDELKQHCWFAERAGELLASSPNLSMPPPREQIAVKMTLYLDQYARGNQSLLARTLRITVQGLRRYLQIGAVPYFDSLLHFCYALSTTPLAFLTEDFLPPQSMPHLPVEHLPQISRGKGKPVTPGDVKQMRQVLETLLSSEEIDPYPSLKEIAWGMGCDVSTIRKHCPDLCRASVMRYKRQWTGEDAQMRMRQGLENALASSERLPLTTVARQIGCDTSTLHKYFPGLCQAVVKRYRERFDYERIHRRLQEVLATSAEVPSVCELARQMGYKVHILWCNYTDLCKQISARYLAQQRKRHEERIAQTFEEIRRAMLELHEQAIYPGARQVCERLKDRHVLRNKGGYRVWRLMLEELGYPTDKLKRYE